MAFNFGSIASTKVSTSTGNYLKPYTINENVTIKSSEIKEGTSAAGNPWKCYSITFGNDEGTYTDSIFWITQDSDFERKTTPMDNGGVREYPSNWERTECKMAAIGYTFFPEKYDKFKDIAAKAKTFDEIIKYYKQLVDANIGKNPTSMKLVGRESAGRVYAALPSCIGITQAKDEKTAVANNVQIGDWYTWVVMPFGDKVSFSKYEEDQRVKLTSAKPTEMPEETEDEIDISSLL